MRYAAFALFPLMMSVAWATENRALTESDHYYGQSLDDLMHVETQLKADVGSRRGAFNVLEATVPIDVITSEQLSSCGTTELSRVLSKLIPGFNYPRPSVTDGTDHAPPFTLRGLQPDQVLVLVNGKRLHQSSLLNINGTIGRGSSSVDLNTIAIRSIERIEVLRDGAAAQYGSDAIAGIINIILKGFGATSGATVSYGQTSQGDGVVRQTDVLYAHPLAEDGFMNLTAEWRDRGSTNRAGADVLDNNRINTHFGDADTQDTLLAIHAEVPNGDTKWYLHGLLDQRHSSAGAFYRRATDDRNMPAIYPDGFLPRIEPDIFDLSFSTGVRGIWQSDTQWDVSYTQGHNDYHFYVNHSLNRSLGEASPTGFDSGGTRYTQQLLNFDLSTVWGQHHLAGGLEFRQERYQIVSGEASSYLLGTESDFYPGAQGFGGFMPSNEVDAYRHNLAGYLDLTYQLRKGMTLDMAVRAENYSNFGSTLDGKVALRVRPNESFLVRTSVGSGFRAPSLTQSYFTSTASLLVNDDIVQFGTFGVDHPVAQALGAKALKPEKSQHVMMGLAYQPSPDWSMSADTFLTTIDDRIMPTGYIATWNLAGLSQQAIDILHAAHVEGAVYFTNAVSTRTHGYDLRLDVKHNLQEGQKLKLAAAYHRSVTGITEVNAAPSILGVPMTDLILDAYTRVTMEQGQPRDSLKLWGKFETPRHDLVLNLNRFGAFSSTAGWPVDFSAQWTLDAQWTYRPAKNIRIILGGENIFDTQPDEWGVTDDSVVGSGKIIPYSQYAPQGYNGRFVYVRLGVDF